MVDADRVADRKEFGQGIGDDGFPWMPKDYTARDRGHALHVLGEAVIIRHHPYDRDPFSGSGNCWCGRHKGARIHEPYPTRRLMRRLWRGDTR